MNICVPPARESPSVYNYCLMKSGGGDSVCIQEEYLPIPLWVNHAVQNQGEGPVL